MPPSSPFQFTTSSTHSTSTPDRPAQPQHNVEDGAQDLAPPAVAAPPSPATPQSTPQQPLEEDSMDIPPDNTQLQPQPQLQPEENSSNTVPRESNAEPEVVVDSAPETLETEPTTSSEVPNAAVLSVDSILTDTEPPVTSATDETVPAPTITDVPATENDPQAEPLSEEPSSQEPPSDSQLEQNSSQDDSQDTSQEPPVEEEEHAYWADIEQDTSSPDEAEMKEIESGDDYSALDYDYWEKTFYRELDDPEYKPAEKARLTWKFKGVRGTKEKPNRATIMRSPTAFIGGVYWTIKFFPRGNNVSSLSIYIESSATPPAQDKDIPETEFKVFKGPPNAVLSDLVPEVDITLPATADSSKATTVPVSASQDDEKQEPLAEGDTEPAPAEELANEQTNEPAPSDPPRDWRVSAQIGVILYNPNEPRTAWMQSSCHQFNSHNVDWGWTTFHGPWDQIHQRQRGQRQALLQSDTLAFDAYIRIIDDPTQSLWWHSSDTEPIWDSLSLTGYRPMGDSVLKYSFEVAGLVSWLLLAPFQEIIQSVDIMEHLTTPGVKPRPLCEALQKLLWALRTQPPAQLFVDTDVVTQTLRNLEEFSRDVMEFWERFRRSLELELAGTDALEKLAKVFDGQMVNNNCSSSNNMITDPAPDEQPDPINCFRGDFNSRIRVLAQTSDNVESAVKQHLGDKPGKWSLPAVLHVELARQKFDKASRHWNLISRRVGLDEELDLSDFVAEPQAGKYSLYGFVVHKGKRTSGQFYSILRPGGPGSRWLAFEDAGDNKIECLTRKAAIDAHEGIAPEEASNYDRSGRDVATVVMYVRNDVLPQFLTGKIEPWEIPETRKRYFELGRVPFSTSSPIAVEAYSLNDPTLVSNSLFDAYDLMDTARSVGRVRQLTLPASTTFAALREKLALWQSNEDAVVKPENIRLWQIGRPKSGFVPPTSQLRTIPDLSQSLLDSELNILRLWMHVLSEDDASFAVLNPPASPNAFEYEHVAEETAQSTDESSTPTNQTPLEDQNAQEPQDVSMADSNHPTDPPQPEERAGTRTPSNQASEAVQVSDEIETPQHETLLSTDSNNDHNNSPADTQQDLSNPRGDVQMTDAEPDANSSQPTQTEIIDADPNAEDVNIQEIVMEAENEISIVQADGTADPAAQTTPEQPIEFQASNEDNSTQPTTTNTEHISTPAPTQEDLVMQDTVPENPTDVTSNENEEAVPTTETTENDINEIAALPFEDGTLKLVPLSAQAYYFIQIFDSEKQEFRVAGVFFARKSSSIKESVRAALGWHDRKQFHLWHRVDGVSILSISSTDRFNKIVSSDRDGECFIVGEVLPKSQCTTISENGSFANPDLLAQYLWALSRQHPTQSFTGTKTIDATFNGEYYSGGFKKGYYHGKGTHISDSGATYTGDFILGKRQGKGIMEFASGDTYNGDWFEDERNGQGTFIERKTGNKYVGGYRAGKRHGKGISYWEVADEEMDLCQICYSEDQDALFYSCGHVCACVSCAKQVDICPMCRKKVANVVKIYRS
ncbi:ubiquitin thiolesterase [[Emmonsia] crescens]|uniref:Ubiquitin thiolesterase n=1 Tax=[Emmonsia] crescens TaxID=73230 RepID=A0A0G2JAB2_9EURO|nr:ubiquitin thiolesterase [Emmonsia crescens UAMH 3008]